jgi:hypothetical protein
MIDIITILTYHRYPTYMRWSCMGIMVMLGIIGLALWFGLKESERQDEESRARLMDPHGRRVYRFDENGHLIDDLEEMTK